MATTQETTLSSIIRHISIAYNVEFMDSTLRIDIDEKKLLELATIIVEQSEAEVDMLHVRIGEYDLKAQWREKRETVEVVTKRGFEKEYNER